MSERDEALEALAEFGEDARILAGGTDLMIQYQRGEINPALLVHIRRIARLRGVKFDGPMTIGALTTHRQLATDELVRRHFPALAEAAATVGGWQTQEAGTVGGNLCNASPAADTVPPLLVQMPSCISRLLEGAEVDDTGQVPLGEATYRSSTG